MPLPISRLAKEIRSNYIALRKHVRLLEEEEKTIQNKHSQP